jgi:predicted permease
MPLHRIRLAVRNLIRRPGFSITAILLLTVAVAANGVVFSVVRSVLLRPLPFAQPERLVALWPKGFVNNEDLDYWRNRTRSFESIAGMSPGWMMSFVASGTEPLKVTGARTSDNFFTTLGTRAVLGRTLAPGDVLPGRTAVVVISYEIFERQFGRDPRTIGRTIAIDSVSHEIVGVMPAGFEFREPGTDVWVPLPFDPSAPQHRAQFSQAFARLRTGAEVDAATRELRSLLPAMRRDLKRPDDWANDMRAVRLQEVVTGDVRPTLAILLAAVGLVLLLAAVNLGTLVLSRTIERSREMAIRTALGASQPRLMLDLLAEQFVLSTTGALTGLLAAKLVLPVLVSRLPPELPRLAEIRLDVVVFAGVLLVSVVISLLLALSPMLIAVRPDLQPVLRQHHGTETPSRRRVLGALVVGQVALALVLGIGAGLMLRSLWKLQRVDPGFSPEHVLTFRLQTTSKYRDLGKGMPYFEQIVERLRGLPGVTHVGSIQHLPMTGYNWTAQVRPVERPKRTGETPTTATWRFIGWDYFEAMRIPLVAGRRFSTRDRNGTVPVAIVNEAYARRDYGDAQSAIGRRVVTMNGRGEEEVEIVGVVRDVRFESLSTPATPEIYRPLAQSFMFPMAFAVQTRGNPAELGAAVRQLAFAVDPVIPVAELQSLPALIAGTLGRPRFLSVLLLVFAAAGLALAVIGVYGVVAYRVRQREREYGIRLALGGRPRRIAASVLVDGGVYAAAGLAVGLPAAFALARLMHSVVFGITPHDPATFVALSVAVVSATILGCALPARRATRVNPLAAIRPE